MRVSDFEALTFDIYGTLIDWEPHIIAFFRAWAARNGVEAADRELLAQFDRARAHYQQLRPALPYPEVLRSAYAYICNHWRKSVDVPEQEAFGASVEDWQPFPDTVEGLAYLKRHVKLGALSNIDDRSLSFSIEKMRVEFDIVVTAERAGAYKPSYPHFVVALNDLGAMGIAPAKLLHVGQSLRADIRPANSLGITSAWIRRAGRTLGSTSHGAELAVPDATFATLAELVEAHELELRR